jgi:hypothetical protein
MPPAAAAPIAVPNPRAAGENSARNAHTSGPHMIMPPGRPQFARTMAAVDFLQESVCGYRCALRTNTSGGQCLRRTDAKTQGNRTPASFTTFFIPLLLFASVSHTKPLQLNDCEPNFNHAFFLCSWLQAAVRVEAVPVARPSNESSFGCWGACITVHGARATAGDGRRSSHLLSHRSRLQSGTADLGKDSPPRPVLWPRIRDRSTPDHAHFCQSIKWAETRPKAAMVKPLASAAIAR